jgi:hypothetical protein
MVEYHRFDGYLVKHFKAGLWLNIDGHLVKHFKAHDS